MRHIKIIKLKTMKNNIRFKNSALKIILFLSFLFFLRNASLEAQNQSQERNQNRNRYGQPGRVLNIVCSFSDYASIAEEIAGENAMIQSISRGEEDPHFIPPKPSYVMLLNKADMWVATGLDLEQWSVTLLDKANNKNIMEGAVGFVSVSDGMKILDKDVIADRAQGDVHLMGNPHINTSPLNWKIVADNITIGLIKVDPQNTSLYMKNRDIFKDRVDRALFGDALVEMFGGPTLCKLLSNNTLFEFLNKDYKGQKLSDLLGGWLKKAMLLRGMKVITYHKNWDYFAEVFGLQISGYIEPKPGIPPSAKHVQDVIKLIKEQNISIMLIDTYFEMKTPQMIEEKTGIKAVYLPLFVTYSGGLEDVFRKTDYVINQIISNAR